MSKPISEAVKNIAKAISKKKLSLLGFAIDGAPFYSPSSRVKKSERKAPDPSHDTSKKPDANDDNAAKKMEELENDKNEEGKAS